MAKAEGSAMQFAVMNNQSSVNTENEGLRRKPGFPSHRQNPKGRLPD